MVLSTAKKNNKQISLIMNKKKGYILLSTLIILFLIITIFIYFFFILDEDKRDNDTVETGIPITCLLTKTYNQMYQEGLLDQIEIVNDSISPYENQAVILEVLRIRHRGILDKLLTPGNAWMTPPTFYFKTNMDGMEYISKDIEQPGNVAEVMYEETWDSMFHETKVVRTVEQEQDTSEITLTIVERE